jgi:hypothetical protein
MPLPYKTTITGVAFSTPWRASWASPSPFNIGVGVVVNSTGITYNVEHTFDNIFGDFPNLATVVSSNATWFQNSGITAATSNANGNYAYPVIGIRLNVTSGSSTGTATMTLIQAGVS